jgi:hypothetical protein
MLDVRQVLAQKEQDLERVRREVEALLRAIPLLEEKPVPSALEPAAKRSSPLVRNLAGPGQGMAELELYYPFVGRSADRH